jgi:5-methylcytosine-specific restriction endonuclease McrA
VTEKPRICGKCGAEKVQKSNGWRCPPCDQETRRLWQEKNREHVRQQSQVWRDKNRDHVRTRHRQWRADNPEKVKAHSATNHANHRQKKNQKSREWYWRNRDQQRERKRRLWAEDPSYKARLLATMKRLYRQRHPDPPQRNLICAKHDAEKVPLPNGWLQCPVCRSDTNRRYRQRHPDKRRALVQDRRARGLQAPGRFTVQEWHGLCQAQGGRCLACGTSGPLTADHVIPLAKGGSNGIENIQPLCRSCNSRKGTKTIDYRHAVHSGPRYDNPNSEVRANGSHQEADPEAAGPERED